MRPARVGTFVGAMLARIDAEAASEWMDPQWPGFSVCDTPGGSCAMQQVRNTVLVR